MELQPILFLLFALGAVVSAVLTVTRRNPVSSAMSLVAHFFMLSGLYLTLEAQFVAAVQVLVYAGAIMVLVVFVIMLLNLGREKQLTETVNLRSVLGSIIGVVFAIQVVIVLVAHPTERMQLAPSAVSIGTTESVGTSLFTTYLFPFEAISLLLLAALIGSVILAKRHVQ